jgi:hypothetical protein
MDAELKRYVLRWERLSGHSLERLIVRWPKAIQREIREKMGGALCGHGEALSKPALRRWRYFLKKLEAHNEKAEQ